MRGRKSKATVVRITAAYCRVSRKEAAADGGSLIAQENRLRALADAHGTGIDDVLIDPGFSGGNLKRPAVQQLLRGIEAGTISAVYVTKLDRLCRSLADLLAIVRLCDKHDVALVSASEAIDTGSPAGRMMLSMLGAFAEFERARIAERISDVLYDKRQQRQAYCRVTPFGFRRIGNDLRPHEEEQKALTTIRRMHGEGASYRQMAEWLTTNGYPPKGKAWYPASVRAVLTSAMNRAS